MRIFYLFLIICILFSFGCSKKKPKEERNLQEIKTLLKEEITKEANEELEKLQNENNNVKIEKEKKLEKEEKKIKAEEVAEQPLVRLDTNDVKLEWTDKKGKLLSALATNFSGNQKTNQLSLSNFTALMYENGVKSAKLKAKRAVVDVVKREIKVTTGVVVESYTNKSVLTANKVLWKAKENKIYAQDGILKTDFGKVQGKFFTLDTQLETFDISDKGLKIE